ncbi:hypothetical protein Pmar_PMAR001199 [Perkinsus marinus ATCC 50983]|uniref:Cilia- and flagella-associated protein 91 n=1 Tax=Perkinsus marinus (strain ATCC 50983 / TXsc) TaxID=423536 RepID=C5KT51_PERM5|nr:hypothetical protein Pmar_PMAR001199 [Perkinsus marinus ATCC 50983]EER12401.1 hypothetical protein Pmar_PMAR001199 [Perkinsus marinus ATCC 50983]|eukprot:XP_002780606.1 hypothetical protein Pmar_PMAR001199 [Perkinsus marinus ATCC 50983]
MPNECKGLVPDLMWLSGLTFQNGMLIGEAAVRLVQIMREKKKAQEALPQGKDLESATLRAKMIEEMELKEFRSREAQIDRINV